jgi:glycosyltransferase involved in cell wall biosynthesis
MSIDSKAEIPTVDVIIPAYNAARYLPAAIESVIAQTCTAWRIILVDDGSVDNTRDIASGYASILQDKLTYIWQPNAGLPAARNAAIRCGSAELLALLDADDIWLPTRLEHSLKAFAHSAQVGLAYGFISRIDADGRVIDTCSAKQKHGEGRIAPYIYRRSVDLPCPTITFRRACLEKAGYFDENLHASEDRDLWLRIAQHYEVRLVPHVIACYRISPHAMTRDPERMLKAQLLFIEKHFGAPGCGWRARSIALSGVYRQYAEALADRRMNRAALAGGVRALLFHPLNIQNLRTTASLLLRAVSSRKRN